MSTEQTLPEDKCCDIRVQGGLESPDCCHNTHQHSIPATILQDYEFIKEELKIKDNALKICFEALKQVFKNNPQAKP